jgi:hypothetical protein
MRRRTYVRRGAMPHGSSRPSREVLASTPYKLPLVAAEQPIKTQFERPAPSPRDHGQPLVTALAQGLARSPQVATGLWVR